jgi:hypothetical protein
MSTLNPYANVFVPMIFQNPKWKISGLILKEDAIMEESKCCGYECKCFEFPVYVLSKESNKLDSSDFVNESETYEMCLSCVKKLEEKENNGKPLKMEDDTCVIC